MNWTQEQYDDYIQSRLVNEPPHGVKRSSQPARLRHTSGEMNKTEAAYAQELEMRKRVGEIEWWAFESIKLRLADRTFYTPDFAVVIAGGMCFHEVKGHWEDDARVKIKVAAKLFPHFTFIALTKIPVKDGGGWKVEEF